MAKKQQGLSEDAQRIHAELAHAYVEYQQTGDGNNFRELMPEARRLGIDPDAVIRDVREMQDWAALASIVEDQAKNAPELLEGVNPKLLNRFLRPRERK